MFWYRDERMINYDFANDESRAKIVLSKWDHHSGHHSGDSITSQLQIFQSRPSDSGNYTCAPSGARSSSIQVHVLEGEYDSIGGIIYATRALAGVIVVKLCVSWWWYHTDSQQLRTALMRRKRPRRPL